MAPIVSTEGAIAAAISVFAGQSLAVSVALTLVVIVAGVVFASVPAPDRRRRMTRPAIRGRSCWRSVTAGLFGISLYATGRAGGLLPASWVVLSARVIGAVALALPLLLSRAPASHRPAAPLVVASGLAEVAGFYSYTLGSRHGLAIAAVLASQFAVIALAGSYVLFKERLSRVQFAGVACVLVGVAVLSALRA